MCTSISKNNFCGRNMDIDYNFGERIIITPRSFRIDLRKIAAEEKHYAFIGTGTVQSDFPLYADAMNENGLYIAALRFSDNAVYSQTASQGKNNIASFEVIPFIMAKCRNINEAKALLNETIINDEPFSENLSPEPLHWHIADKSGSITVECTHEGMRIHDNPFNVLSNNPTFPFHVENMRQYQKLTASYDKKLNPFGSGFGALGLPGDFSSCSRFVKADFLLKNLVESENRVMGFFHILDGVAIPKGAVLNPAGKYHYTTYCCCFDRENLIYFYKTYESSGISAVKMTAENMSGGELICFSHEKSQPISFKIN